MPTDPEFGELAAAAEELRESAERDEAAGLIPASEGEARRTAAEILEDWQQQVNGKEVER